LFEFDTPPIALVTTKVLNGFQGHLIFTIEENTIMKICMDGELIDSKLIPFGPMSGKRDQDILLLGAAPVLSDPTLSGAIQEFQICFPSLS
jgi:hypothetical protein